jgi:hypothetical protein
VSELDGVQIDAKTRFYLERRQQIEEWSALRPDAERLRYDVLDGPEGLVSELRRVADAQRLQSAGPSTLQLVDCWTGRWRILSFAPSDRPLERDGTPAAAVCVSWERNAFPDDGNAVSVGVRVTRRANDHAATHAQIVEATRDHQRDRRYRTSSWWPLWECVTAPDTSTPDVLAWWDDPQPFIDAVLNVVDYHLHTFGPIVDEVLRARGTQQ